MLKNDWSEYLIEYYKELYIFNALYPFNLCDLIMIKMISFRGLFGLGLAVLLSSAVLANEDLSPAEANSLIKEDLAATQVMTEVCPAILGKNTKFDQNIQQLIQSHLEGYSDTSITFEKIRMDNEYQAILDEARQAAKKTSQEEQKSVCNDVINYQAYS